MYIGAVPCNGIRDSETVECLPSEESAGEGMGNDMVISFEDCD